MSATWSLDIRGEQVYVGHTVADDDTAPIYSLPVPRRWVFLEGLDLRCPTCPGHVRVFRGEGENTVGGPLDGHDYEAEPLIIVEHDDGCAAFAEYRQWWTQAAAR